MTKRLKKFTSMILAGLLACFSLTACSDEVEVKPDEPMGPSEILNALKNASDYTVTAVNFLGDTDTLKKDGQIVHYTTTIESSYDEYYCDYSKSSSVVSYDLVNGVWSKYEYSATAERNHFDEDVRRVFFPIENLDVLFNDAYYTSIAPGSYSMTAEGLAAMDLDSVTITITGLIYTFKLDSTTITIDFSDTVLTLPPVA